LPNESASTDPTTNDSDLRVLIGVCTLNEAANIVPLITRLRLAIPEADILVIDDESSDDTAGLVTEMVQKDQSVMIVVRHDQRGLGSAIRHAMTYSIEHAYSYFLNLDGDLSHDPDQLPSLLQCARQSPAVDVVIGSRYVPGGSIVGWPIHRKLMSRMVNRFATSILRLPVKDCSGSMRCYRVDALSRIGMSTLHSNGYALLEELLVRLHRQNSKMAEVPITFTDRREGKSKLTLREAIRSTGQMLAMALRH
jgi:dolichol-phosphate mannosyltransferase